MICSCLWKSIFYLIIHLITKSQSKRICHHSRQVNILSSFNGTLPLSRYECTGDDAIHRTCIFENVFTIEGTIVVISHEKEVPEVLCGSTDKVKGFANYCRFQLYTPEMGYEILSQKKKTCILSTDIAIAIGRLNPYNYYHTLFEDLIPTYELIKKHKELSSFVTHPDTAGNLSLPNLLFYFTDYKKYGKLSLKRFEEIFPHVELLESYVWNHPQAYIKKLYVGLNNSCIHYDHCSRSSYVNKDAAIDFRYFLFDKAGIDVSHEKRMLADTQEYSAKMDTYVNNRIPVINVVARVNTTRGIRNLEKLIQTIHTATGVMPNVIDYASMNLFQQMNSTFHSDIWILIHGGGLGNMLFLPFHATVIDIYPYSYSYAFQGLVNWVRFSMQKLYISHMPYEITESKYMYFRNDAQLPENCLCDTSTRANWLKCAFEKMFLCVKSIEIDLDRFHAHVKEAYANWRHSVTYNPALSAAEFKIYSESFKEPWYYKNIKKQAAVTGSKLPSCMQKNPCQLGL